ncbi:MAG: hypothetical protein J5756_04570 [Clostridia bacterium]|nr:hypothetical protein [Clostridia bacterium]
MRWLEYVLFGAGFIGFVAMWFFYLEMDYYILTFFSIGAYALTLSVVFGEIESHIVIFLSGLLDGIIIAGWIWAIMDRRYNISIENKEKEKDK